MIKLSRLAALLVAGTIASAPTFAADKGTAFLLPALVENVDQLGEQLVLRTEAIARQTAAVAGEFTNLAKRRVMGPAFQDQRHRRLEHTPVGDGRALRLSKPRRLVACSAGWLQPSHLYQFSVLCWKICHIPSLLACFEQAM